MRSLWASLLLVLVLVASLVNTAAQMQQEQKRRVMAGGYAPIRDLDEEMVTTAAAFAVSQLPLATQTYSFLSSSSKETDFQDRFKIVKGYQQVVAGMNYRLVIMVMNGDDSEECLGGFSVTVYNRFGDMSVTKWSSEVSCKKAQAIMDSEDDFHQTYEEDFM